MPNPDAFRATARIFVEQAGRVSAAFADTPTVEQLRALAEGGPLSAPEEQHGAVCAFVGGLKEASRQSAVTPDAHLFVAKCAEYDRYIDKLAGDFRANARSEWAASALKSSNDAGIAKSIDEIAAHIRAFALPAARYESMAMYAEARLSSVLPPEVANLRQEANLTLILPFFEKSLAVPGDAAEFGCFRGILSVKLAWLLKAAGAAKHYYTFDTFHGFEINDPAGGALGIGSFRDDAFNAYEFLTGWSRTLPLTPVKGDATVTCSTLTKPLSFVWLDLDMDVLMDPVLRTIFPLCSPDTIIGVDDVGRPETPTVGPWLQRLIDAGALEVIFSSDDVAPNTFIRFLKKKGELPPR